MKERDEHDALFTQLKILEESDFGLHDPNLDHQYVYWRDVIYTGKKNSQSEQ